MPFVEKPLISFNSSFSEKRLLEVAEKFDRALDKLEYTPLIFSVHENVTSIQTQRVNRYIEAGKSLKAVFKKYRSPAIDRYLKTISQKIVGLKYRIESLHGGLDPLEADKVLYEKLLSLATEWKSKQPLYSDRTLTPRDLQKINETACYPKFCRLLVGDDALRERFFKWMIQDNNKVKPFIEFPAVCARIESVALSMRLGRFAGEGLSIKKKNARKEIRLPFFDGTKARNISILDEDKIVTLNGDYQLTIKNIFEVFRDKKIRPGKLEIFGIGGITNWNTHELGWWSPSKNDYERTDLSSHDWWKDLPVLEILDKEKVEKKYQVSLDKNEWVAAIVSTRSYPIINLEESHGYMEVAIPDEKGSYQIVSFGKFASVYPNGTWELLTFLANTVIGRIAYPDENTFYSNRQQAFYPVLLSPEEGAKMMGHIKEDLLKARQNNVVFQFSGENCAYWAYSIVQKSKPLPNLFKIYLLDVQPINPALAIVFSLFRSLPKIIQRPIINGFDRCLGSHRKIVVIENGQPLLKSLMRVPTRNEQSVFIPALLHNQIEESKIKGVVAYGH